MDSNKHFHQIFNLKIGKYRIFQNSLISAIKQTKNITGQIQTPLIIKARFKQNSSKPNIDYYVN